MRPTPVRRAPALPWWLGGSLALACVVLGCLLAVRPFRSLGVLLVLLAVGLVLAGAALVADRARALPLRGLGLLVVAAGVAVPLVPGLTIRALTLIVAVGMVVLGLARVLKPRGAADERVSSWLLGLASVVIGVVALAWPDVTVLVVAAVFGVQLVILGLGQAAEAWRRRPGVAEPATRGQGGARWPRTLWAGVALVAALGLLLLSTRLDGTPQPDAFYAAPAEVPAGPGQLVRSEPFTTDVPADAVGWRILYTTTTGDDAPAVASAIVIAPAAGSRHPVIAWAHGTTGQATGCAPSLLEHPFEAGAMPDLPAVLRQGWAVVAPDYPGLGTEGSHPYLIGEPTGRSVLDAIRAAQQLTEAGLGARTIVWGHSQGGHAALWTGGLATGYAPELELAGVVAMAPASNLPDLLGNLAGSRIGSLFGAYVLASYSEAHPEVRPEAYVRPGARIGVEEMSRRCLSDPSSIVSVATAVLGRDPVWSGNPARDPLLARMARNVPTLAIEAPLLVAQGEADTLVLPASQADWVAQRCAAGQELEYRTYPGRDHMGLVAGDSPLLEDLFTWSAARFRGDPATPDC